MKLSNRVLEMEESVTLAANARAKALAAEGRDILSLTLGQPDFATPKNIQEAAVASIEDGRASFYTVASGLPELKDAISDYMKEFYGYTVLCRPGEDGRRHTCYFPNNRRKSLQGNGRAIGSSTDRQDQGCLAEFAIQSNRNDLQ